MIPPLDKFGLLPAGVYDCTVDEIGERFGGASDSHRRDIFNGFVRWRGILLRRMLPVEIYADGSFTTNKDRPGDVDVALRLTTPSSRRLRAELVAANELLDPDITKPRYSVDPWTFSDAPGEPTTENYVRFFCGMAPEDARQRAVPPSHIRGILRVCP